MGKGYMKHIDVGSGRILGVNAADKIYMRAGVTKQRPTGTAWQLIRGGLKQISTGGGRIVGVNSGNAVYARTKIMNDGDSGRSWTKPKHHLKYVDVDENIMVGVNEKDEVYYRSDMTQRAFTKMQTEWPSNNSSKKCSRNLDKKCIHNKKRFAVLRDSSEKQTRLSFGAYPLQLP